MVSGSTGEEPDMAARGQLHTQPELWLCPHHNNLELNTHSMEKSNFLCVASSEGVGNKRAICWYYCHLKAHGEGNETKYYHFGVVPHASGCICMGLKDGLI